MQLYETMCITEPSGESYGNNEDQWGVLMIPQPPHPHHSHQHHHLHVTNLPHKWCVQWQVLMGGGWGCYPHYIVVPTAPILSRTCHPNSTVAIRITWNYHLKGGQGGTTRKTRNPQNLTGRQASQQNISRSCLILHRLPPGPRRQ